MILFYGQAYYIDDGLMLQILVDLELLRECVTQVFFMKGMKSWNLIIRNAKYDKGLNLAYVRLAQLVEKEKDNVSRK